MGETQDRPFQLSFNRALKVDFQGSRVTSDSGLVLVRELDERLGLGELVDRHMNDSRRGKNIQLPLADLLRQSIYSRLAGYEDVNDAARLSQDPTFRLIGSRKIWERGAALTSGGCESRVPLRGVVPPRGLHRDQSWDFKPGGGALATTNGWVASDASWEEIERAFLKVSQVPLGRIGRVDEVAHAVVFLCSPLASYITGADLRIDGGVVPAL